MNIEDSEQDGYQAFNPADDVEGTEERSSSLWLYLLGFLIGLSYFILMFISYTHYLGMALSLFVLICAIFKMCIDIASNRKRLRDGGKTPLGVNRTTSKILKISYVIFLVFTFLLLVIRVYNIIKSPIVTKFPSTCTPEDGCSRVSYNGTHRAEDVDMDDVMTYTRGSNTNSKLSEIIKECLNGQFQSNIMYERHANENGTTFYHASFASMVFGFVDDMYVGKYSFISFFSSIFSNFGECRDHQLPIIGTLGKYTDSKCT